MSFIIQGIESVGSDLENFFGSASSDIQHGISSITGGISSLIKSLVDGIIDFIGDVKKFVSEVAKHFEDFVKSVDSFFGNAYSVIKTVIGDIIGFFKNLPQEFMDAVNFIKKEIEILFTDLKKIMTGVVDDIVSTIISFFNNIKCLMMFAFNWIRYEFNYLLYYLATHAQNLIGGFIFGLYLNEIRKHKPASIGDLMKHMLTVSLKYGFLDMSMMSLFTLYSIRGKIRKPTPPTIPILSGIRLV